MAAFLETPIEYLKGIGPQRGEVLKKELQVFSFNDLIQLYPFRYVDKTKFYKVSEITEDMPFVQLKGQIIRSEVIGVKQARRLVAQFRDESGSIELLWFQGIKWLEGKFKPGIEYIVFGRPVEYKGRFNIPHPEVDVAGEEGQKVNSALQAVYPSTEHLKNRGLDSKGILKLQQTLNALISGTIPETLTQPILSEFNMLSREEALKQIHFPESPELLKKAEFRIKFEELFLIQLRLLRMKQVRTEAIRGFIFGKVGNYFNDFYNHHLPFQLTNAQKRVIKEIRGDTGSGKQMNRLVQGDVGSGKTMVALMSMLIALDNGFQTALMAPTEILAAQHFTTISEQVRPLGIQVALLTGSTKAKERRMIHEDLVNGKLQILIGTHALIEDTVQFKNLGFVVIDEQHRFGVAQRGKLREKNVQPPHILIMTATPIPRTLAMTLYGDLDTSVIDELPPGRKPIRTVHYGDNKRLQMLGFIREQIALGRQVYVVYPLIQESEKVDLKNLQEGFESLEREFPMPEYQISIVHGKMSAEKKEFEMGRFVRGETNIMVATTVIEVGVNIPNASVMVIESAERFGLSQLHQLRGRVGRGADQSYCILMTSFKLSRESKLRMDTMCRTNDGFEISEVDLQLRGPGDLAGTQQSGVMNLRLADLAKDQQILQYARNSAQQILNEDPDLSKPENKILVEQLANQGKHKVNWSKVA
ncbi:MAG: ATP-dependent DNA helicase RecG [Bacteroidia bacterium]